MVEEAKIGIGSAFKFKCGKTIKNRIVKGALAEFYAEAEEGGDYLEFHNTLYKRWADGGAGMLLTGHVFVDRDTKGAIQDPVLDEKSSIDTFKKVAECCKSTGCLGVVQLNHPGRQAFFSRGDNTFSPSEVPLTGPMAAGCKPPKALTEAQILDIIAKFVRSADLCKTAGFDGVELHCAHGFLLSSFLSSIANVREDKWGGSTENRSRIIMEIIKQVREKLGPEMIVGIKINSSDFQKGGLTEEECTEVLKALDANPLLDFIELSGGSFESPKMMESAVPMKESTKLREGFFIEFAAKLTAVVTKIPIMITGGLRSLEGMQKALEVGVSLIGVARPFCYDPDWCNKMLKGEITSVIDKTLDPAQNIPFHIAQINRIGKGLEPDMDIDLTPPPPKE